MGLDFLDRFQSPMEPLPCSEIKQDGGYIHQVKWDGIRVISVINQNRVKLFTKHLQERTEQYGELHDLPGRVEARSAILDGEIIVLKNGKPSFPEVMRRANCSSQQQKTILQKTCPIEYMVFDLLYLNGNILIDVPLSKRQLLLQETIIEKDYLHIVESFEDGLNLFTAIESMGMEGIVSKDKQSPYIQGKNHRFWQKIKCKRLQNFLLGGYTLRGRIVNSLLLGVHREDGLYYVGKAGNGLDTECQQVLSEYLPNLEIDQSPFVNLTAKSGLHFIQPGLGAEIEFMEWTDDLKLRFPIIKQIKAIKAEKCMF